MIISSLTVAGTVVGVVAAPLVFTAVGFGSAGIAAGSLAAAIQTPNIVAGSAFAIAQSIGATGGAAVIGLKIGVISGAATGITGDVIRRFLNYYRS